MAKRHAADILAEALRRRYEQAQRQTIERLAEAVRQGRSPTYYQSWLRQIEHELARLREDSQGWAAGTGGQPGAVAQAFQAGGSAAGLELTRAGVRLDTTFAMPHRDAIRVAVQNTILNLDEALAGASGRARGWMNIAATLADGDLAGPLQVPLIGRRVDDLLRRMGLEGTARKLGEGLTIHDMRKILLHDLVTEGIGVIRDQVGRTWSLDAYASMVARTTTREAYTAGTVDVVQRAGHDLLRISEHWPTCPICAVVQGRVVSVSGRSMDWPSARAVGLPPYHPNCLHSVAPFIEELADEEETARLRGRSNQPLDIDPRATAEREAYDRTQRRNVLRRERRQLLATRGTGEVPLDAHMRRWTGELKRPDLDPASRRELQEKLGARAERWEQGRRARLKEVNAELRGLAREHREAIRQEHRRLLGAGTPRTTVMAAGRRRRV